MHGTRPSRHAEVLGSRLCNALHGLAELIERYNSVAVLVYLAQHILENHIVRINSRAYHTLDFLHSDVPVRIAVEPVKRAPEILLSEHFPAVHRTRNELVLVDRSVAIQIQLRHDLFNLIAALLVRGENLLKPLGDLLPIQTPIAVLVQPREYRS